MDMAHILPFLLEDSLTSLHQQDAQESVSSLSLFVSR
jgi:hypothetical protein